MTRVSSVLVALGVLAGLSTARRARAFEREWHVGGGAGFTVYPHYYDAGPALGANLAYGLSDVFDLKGELLASYHGYDAPAGGSGEHAALYSAVVGLSYKLDVLQWIPYAAALVGYQHIAGALPRESSLRRNDALFALVLGVDYAMTRDFGLGISLRSDTVLASPTHGESFTPMLRAEYHWGF